MSNHGLLSQLLVRPVSGDDKAALTRARQEYGERRDDFLRAQAAGATHRQLALVCCSGDGTLARGERCNFVRPFIVLCANELTPATAAAAAPKSHAAAWDAADLAHLQSLSTSRTQLQARLPPPNASAADIRKFNKNVMDGFMTHRRCKATAAASSANCEPESPLVTLKTAAAAASSNSGPPEAPGAKSEFEPPQAVPSMQSIANQLASMSKQLAHMSSRVEELEQQLATRGTKRRRRGRSDYGSSSSSGGEEEEEEEEEDEEDHQESRDARIRRKRGERLIRDSKEIKFRRELTVKDLRRAAVFNEHALARLAAEDRW